MSALSEVIMAVYRKTDEDHGEHPKELFVSEETYAGLLDELKEKGGPLKFPQDPPVQGVRVADCYIRPLP